jgi:hypothetical protein
MDAKLVHDGTGSESPFCGNPECMLHVRVGAPGVQGSGNWAVLENGQMMGRGLYGTAFLCDACGRRQVRGLPSAMATLL